VNSTETVLGGVGESSNFAKYVENETRIILRVERQDEVKDLFTKGLADEITIGGERISAVPNKGSAKIFEGVSDANIEQYFLDLTGAERLPSPVQITIPSTGATGNLYIVKTHNGSFNLRDVSTSSEQSGARWTIDVPGAEVIGRRGTFEIKFR
jgi:hypothetical protein